MSDQQRLEIERLLREGPLDLGGDVAEQRVVFENLMAALPLPEDVTTTPTQLGGVPALEIRSTGVREDRVVLFLHGGAFALGSAASTAGLAASIGRVAGALVLSVDYRLAPEHPYPAGLDDVLAAYDALLGRFDAGHVAVVGESAGGGLALAALTSGFAAPAALALLSPWVDLTLSGDSMSDKAEVDPALTAEGLRRRAADYGDASGGPLFAGLRGLPPLLIQAGSHEVLLDDATRLAARAAAADVLVRLEVTPRAPHVFQSFAGHLDEADAALQSLGSFLRDHTP